MYIYLRCVRRPRELFAVENKTEPKQTIPMPPADPPATSTGRSIRAGPLFCIKDQSVYVKTSSRDAKRAVLNATSMTLVDYADSSECRDEELRSDPSLFVPIFCKECYGTEDADYAEALARVRSSGSGTFVVGVCSVYGLAPDETYPESRADFAVGNELSYSGACHPQPGRAVFLHEAGKDIGRVECYWHVHSKSIDKTFLFCCVSCDSTEYAKRLLGSLTQDGAASTAFSLGTVGDNAYGPVTEECSLVSVPVRPGCFCVAVADGDAVTRTMIRMGFCSVKDAALEAGLRPEDEGSRPADVPQGDGEGSRGEGEDAESVGDAGVPQGPEDEARAAMTLLAKQAEEIRALKDALKAVKVQNGVLKQRLSSPEDPDAMFTARGARDFTERTGLRNKLCAGETKAPSAAVAGGHTNATVSADEASGAGAAMDPGGEQQPRPLSGYELEELRRLLPPRFAVDERAQQHTNGQRRDRPEQPRPLVARGAEHVPYYYSYGDGRSPAGTFEKTAHRDTLTEEQKRDIALAYNKRESEKEEASRKKREEMIAMIKTSVGDMIKTGIRDAMLERGYGDAVERDEQGDGVSRALARADPELRNLARDTPYNRRGRTPDRRRSPLAAASRDGDASVDVPSLLRELKELREQSARREDGKRKVESEETVSLMDTDDDERRCENATVPTAEPDARIGTRLPDNVTKKQQAGYPPPSRDADPVSDKHRLMEEFVSAVSTLR